MQRSWPKHANYSSYTSRERRWNTSKPRWKRYYGSLFSPVDVGQHGTGQLQYTWTSPCRQLSRLRCQPRLYDLLCRPPATATYRRPPGGQMTSQSPPTQHPNPLEPPRGRFAQPSRSVRSEITRNWIRFSTAASNVTRRHRNLITARNEGRTACARGRIARKGV